MLILKLAVSIIVISIISARSLRNFVRANKKEKKRGTYGITYIEITYSKRKAKVLNVNCEAENFARTELAS